MNSRQRKELKKQRIKRWRNKHKEEIQEILGWLAEPEMPETYVPAGPIDDRGIIEMQKGSEVRSWLGITESRSGWKSFLKKRGIAVT